MNSKRTRSGGVCHVMEKPTEQSSLLHDLPRDLQDDILERLSHLHRSGAAMSCRLFRDHHASVLVQQSAALEDKISKMDTATVDLFVTRMLEMVSKIQVDGREENLGWTYLPGENSLMVFRPSAETVTGDMVTGGSSFRITLSRAKLETERKMGVEGWSLAVSSVSVEAVAVALKVVRALQQSLQVASFAFKQVTFLYARKRAPTAEPAAKALFDALTYFLHQLHVQPSDELLEVLRAGKWAMWSTKALCCSEKP